MRIVVALLAAGSITPAQAQSGNAANATIAYERMRDRFHYRFKNPSSFDQNLPLAIAPLVPYIKYSEPAVAKR